MSGRLRLRLPRMRDFQARKSESAAGKKSKFRVRAFPDFSTDGKKDTVAAVPACMYSPSSPKLPTIPIIWDKSSSRHHHQGAAVVALRAVFFLYLNLFRCCCEIWHSTSDIVEQLFRESGGKYLHLYCLSVVVFSSPLNSVKPTPEQDMWVLSTRCACTLSLDLTRTRKRDSSFLFCNRIIHVRSF